MQFIIIIHYCLILVGVRVSPGTIETEIGARYLTSITVTLLCPFNGALQPLGIISAQQRRQVSSAFHPLRKAITDVRYGDNLSVGVTGAL
jgi:hypothetical protein